MFLSLRLQALFAFLGLRVRLCGHGSLTVAGQAMQVQFGLPAGGPCCAEVLVLQQRPFLFLKRQGICPSDTCSPGVAPSVGSLALAVLLSLQHVSTSILSQNTKKTRSTLTKRRRRTTEISTTSEQ